MARKTVLKRTSLRLLIRAGAAALAIVVVGLFGLRLFAPDIWSGLLRVSDRQWQSLADRYYDRRVSPAELSRESANERAKLPFYKIVAALAPERRTPHLPGVQGAGKIWPRSSGDDSSTRFSQADIIDPANVSRLKPIWTYRDRASGNVQATPVFDGERLYIVTTRGSIAALDPSNGQGLWDFKAKEPAAKRGLIVHRQKRGAASVVYFSAGAKLYALDGRTGKPRATFSGGSVNLTGEPKVAPAICGDRIVIANTGNEPSIETFELETGKQGFRIGLTPRNLPPGTGGRPSRLTGGNPWGGISVDPLRCIAFVSTGNPAPVLVGVERPGSNPNTSSVIAIDLKRSRILWRFQETAHDLWDYDLPAAPVLTSIMIDGRAVDVVATPTKVGNTLLLDRVTGKPIFDWRLRRAPVSSVPGERTAEYQPDPVLPQPFARSVFLESDVTDIGAANRAAVLAIIGNAAFGFYEPPSANRPLVVYGLHGGAEWPGAAADPHEGSLFVAANNVASILRLEPVRQVQLDDQHPGRAVFLSHCAACHGEDLEGALGPAIRDAGRVFGAQSIRAIVTGGQQAMPPIRLSEQDLKKLTGYLTSGTSANGDLPRFRRANYVRLYDHEGYPGVRPPWGTLTRMNLATGRIVWQVPLGKELDLEKHNILNTGTENIAGLLATATGLIFASGTKDRMIHAFAADDGRLLWSHDLPFVGSAPPMTYVFRGKQYVVIPATGGGTLALYDRRVATGGSFVAFALSE